MISEDWGTAVRVSNKSGRAVSILGADEDGHGTLGVGNVLGSPVVAMGADGVADGVLSVANRSGSPAADLSINVNGNGIAQTYSRDGSVRWSSEMSSGGQTGLLGDFDGDGDVDFTDFLVFAQNFGKTSG